MNVLTSLLDRPAFNFESVCLVTDPIPLSPKSKSTMFDKSTHQMEKAKLTTEIDILFEAEKTISRPRTWVSA
jgi:hypothetical protein